MYLRPAISSNDRSKASQLMKEIFKVCPICQKYSFKPNYNMNLIPDPQTLASIVLMQGRRCKLCGFISEPKFPV